MSSVAEWFTASRSRSQSLCAVCVGQSATSTSPMSTLPPVTGIVTLHSNRPGCTLGPAFVPNLNAFPLVPCQRMPGEFRSFNCPDSGSPDSKNPHWWSAMRMTYVLPASRPVIVAWEMKSPPDVPSMIERIADRFAGVVPSRTVVPEMNEMPPSGAGRTTCLDMA